MIWDRLKTDIIGGKLKMETTKIKFEELTPEIAFCYSLAFELAVKDPMRVRRSTLNKWIKCIYRYLAEADNWREVGFNSTALSNLMKVMNGPKAFSYDEFRLALVKFVEEFETD